MGWPSRSPGVPLRCLFTGSAHHSHEDPDKHHGKANVVAGPGGNGPSSVSPREDASAHGQRGLLACDSGNLDLKPAAQTCAEVLPRRTGRLIGPRHLLIPSTVDDRIIKLDTVQRSEICICKYQAQ
jgi:hypothetical protein